MSKFIPEFDNMHISSTEDNYQFNPGIFEHVDPYFHSEQFVNQAPSMHYESQDSYFVFPAQPIENFYLSGETKDHESFRLPHHERNENQVFDRGKGIVEVRWPGAIFCT